MATCHMTEKGRIFLLSSKSALQHTPEVNEITKEEELDPSLSGCLRNKVHHAMKAYWGVEL